MAFLESKGLTQNEIQESIKRASGGSNQTIVSNPNMINQPQPPPFTPQGYLPVQQYSQSNYWKDILLGIMLTGSAGYGLFYLLKV